MMHIHKYSLLHFTDTKLTGTRFKVNGYTFKGSNSCIFIFASHLIRGQLLKERICSSRSKFFPLRVDPFGRASSSREANRKSQKLIPLAKKLQNKHEGVPTHFMVSTRGKNFLLSPCFVSTGIGMPWSRFKSITSCRCSTI